jgi:hypothetical protein
MISIGAHYRGPELEGSAIDTLIVKATKAAKAGRPTDYEAHRNPAVNVIFYVSGSLGGFDIPKIEASRFSRKQKLLLVAVPVPEDMAKSGGSVEFVIGALRQAVAIAAEVFAKKNVGAFDLAGAERIIEEVQAALTTQPG